ncbi:MAG: AraC family transcriptional regulator [Pseudomonadota bacterium]
MAAADGATTTDVPRIRGSSVADVVDRAGRAGVFAVEPADGGPTTRFPLVRFEIGDHQAVVDRSDRACLVLTMHGKGRLRAEYEGQPSDSPIHRGSLTWAPIGVDQTYDFTGRSTNLAVTIPSRLMDGIRDRTPQLRDVRLDEPLAPFVNPGLARMVEEQHRLMTSGDMAWRALADAQMVRLTVELMCQSANRRIGRPSPMSTAELRLVEEYLRAHLDRNVTLEEVVALTDRPVHGFCRAFRATTGRSFHRFALGLRLDEAERLLTETDTRLVEIAYATGFSSQSHLTSTMNRKRGITPGRLRRTLQDPRRHRPRRC